MPFIEVDKIPDGYEASDVVERSVYDEVATTRDNALGKIEELNAQVRELTEANEQLHVDLQEAKNKFANAFLTTPQKIIRSQKKEMKNEEKPPVTFATLFKERPRNAS